MNIARKVLAELGDLDLKSTTVWLIWVKLDDNTDIAGNSLLRARVDYMKKTDTYAWTVWIYGVKVSEGMQHERAAARLMACKAAALIAPVFDIASPPLPPTDAQ